MNDQLFEIFCGAIIVLGIVFVTALIFAVVVAICENIPPVWRSLKAQWRNW